MRPPALLMLVLAILHFDQAKSSHIGNDIIVNIGQTNGYNRGGGYNGTSSKEAGISEPPAPLPSKEDPPGTSKPNTKEMMCSANGQTIQVESNSVQGHLNAGAKLGHCPRSTVVATSIAPMPDPEPMNYSMSPPTSPAPTPRSTTTPLTKTPVAASPTEPPIDIPICLPIVNSTILIPANILGAFLEKGASIGACAAAPANPPAASPVPVPAVQPAQPAVIARSTPIRISGGAAQECDIPAPMFARSMMDRQQQSMP